MRTTLTHATRAFAPFLLSAVLLAGCGDDKEPVANATTTTVDEQAVIDQVNGICTRFNAEFDDLAAEETELLSLAEKAITFYDDAIDDFKAVEASGDVGDTLDKMVESLEQARDDMSAAVESGDEAEVQAAGEAIDERNQGLDEEVADAGFTECNDESEDETTTTEEEEASGSGTLTHVDLTDLLTAPTGFALQSVDEATVAGLSESLEAEPAVIEIADTFGTTTVYEGETPQGLLIFVGLKETPDEATRSELLAGIAGAGSDTQTVTIDGSEGVKYTDPSGNITFATVRNDSILMAISDNEAALEAIVGGLFEQNPDL